MGHNRCVRIGNANILTVKLIYMTSEKLDTLVHISSCDWNIDYENALEFSE